MRRPAGRDRPWTVFGILVAGVMTFAMLQSMITPVLADVQTDLHTSQTSVTWLLTAYFLSSSVATPIVGRIGDVVGRKPTLIATLLVLTAGSVLAALSTSVAPMIAARVVQGAAGGVLPLAFGIVRDEMPPPKVPTAISIVSALAAVGGGVGIVIAGPVVTLLGFHWLFWLPAIVTALTAVAALAFVPSTPPRSSGAVGLLPAALLSAWLVCLLVALSQGGRWGWGSWRTLVLLAAAPVVARIWVAVERRSSSPLVDLRTMRLPTVWTTNLVALLVGFGIYTFIGFAPRFTQTPESAGYGFGASVTESGVLQMPTTVMMFAISLASGRVSRRIGTKAAVVTGNLVSTGAMAVLALAHDRLWQVCLAHAVLGLGTGLVMSCLANLVIAAVPPEQTGVVSGMNANIRWIGGSVGGAVMAAIVAAETPLGSALPDEAGYTWGFLALTAAFAVAAVVSLLVPRAPAVGDEAFVAQTDVGLVAASTVDDGLRR